MFAGVGSTLKSAINMGRNCIAIELDKNVYKDGLQYINE